MKQTNQPLIFKPLKISKKLSQKAKHGAHHENHDQHSAHRATTSPKKVAKNNAGHAHHQNHDHNAMVHNEIKGAPWKVWTRFSALIVLFLFYTFYMIAGPQGAAEYALHWGIWLPLTSYVVLIEGRQLFKLYPRLIKAQVDMYTLIGLASHLIYLYCVVNIGLNWNASPHQMALPWEAPALVIVVAMAGEYFESTMRASVAKAMQQLQSLRQQSVNLWIDNQLIKTPLADAPIGSLMQVSPGEMVLLDGLSVNGGRFDYANITGEAKIQVFAANAFITSGAFNSGEMALIKTTTSVSNATLFQLVERFFVAALAKPKLQRSVDKILKWFVLGVLALALITFSTWLALGLTNNVNLPWNANVGLVTTPGEAWRVAVEVAVSVLAIACPCALGMATPIISAVTAKALSLRGVIINEPAAMENMATIKTVALDKTGTITNANLIISEYQASAQHLAIAKSLEQGVNHPVAAAFTALPHKTIKMTNVKLISSGGVSGTYRGATYELKSVAQSTLKNAAHDTLIGLFENKVLVAEFALTNQLRPHVASVITHLKQRDLKVVMLTGDQHSVAESVGRRANIDEVHAHLQPQDKAQLISVMRERGPVLFIGDGFNDALAVQAADLSAAFASGSAIVNNAVNLSIINDDFSVISDVFDVAQKHVRNVKISLAWALIFNVLALPLAALFLVPPWGAALLMTGSSLIVIINALIYQWQIKRKKAPK